MHLSACMRILPSLRTSGLVIRGIQPSEGYGFPLPRIHQNPRLRGISRGSVRIRGVRQGKGNKR
jgi:hypothetical protein